jgi:hypothetical protein
MAGGYDRLVGRLLNLSRRGFQNDKLTLGAGWEACYRAGLDGWVLRLCSQRGWDGPVMRGTRSITSWNRGRGIGNLRDLRGFGGKEGD